MVTPERVRDVRERVLAAGVVTSRADWSARPIEPVSIGAGEGQALLHWIRREEAQRTFETGLGFGISALFICEGLLANGSDVGHVAMDPHQFDGLPDHLTTYAGVALELLEEAGIRDLVEFHAEGSEIVLPRLLAERRNFDLAFIDGNHRFEGVFLDLIYAGKLLKEGGIVVVDDVQLPGVSRAIDFCLSNLDWAAEDEGREGEEHRWAVLRTGPGRRFRRPITDFVDF